MHGAMHADQARWLDTLERLLDIPAVDLTTALSHAVDLVAEATASDKVDAFLFDARRDSLVALGTSNQPLSALQKKLGLDVLPLANGGRVVHVFKTGETFVTGHLESDMEELKGVREGMGIRSKLGVPLEIGGSRRGMMMLASQKPDHFSEADVRFTQAAARWVSALAHRAELVQEVERNALAHGRRVAADELVTILAHDLRNYLSPVHARLHLVRHRAERENRAPDVEDLSLALRGMDGIAALITDILDVARIDQGLFRLDASVVDLGAFLLDLAHTFGTDAQPIIVKVPEPIVIAADAQRLRQCLSNVLANALKHSPKNAPVTLHAALEIREDGQWARVEVIDEGPGVPAPLLPRIFERFVGGQSAGTNLGLGLYLAKRVAELHGGDLAVDSPPGRGARFVLTVPAFDETRSDKLEPGNFERR